MSIGRHMVLLILTTSTLTAQFYFGRNKIQYYPFDWHVLSTEHFDIYYYKEEAELATVGASFAEGAFKELEKKFNFTLIKKVPLVFYSSHIHFEQTNTIPYLIPEGVGGFFEFVKGRVVIPYDGSTYQFKEVIRHELVHVFTHNKIAQILRLHNIQTYRSPPLWFTEGLAEFWSFGWDSKAEMVIRDALLNDYLVPLDRLDLASFGFLLYKEGQSFLRFVDSVYGREKILLIMENMWRDSNFYKIIEGVLEKDFQEISDEWKYFYKKNVYPLLDTEEAPRRSTMQITKRGINATPIYYRDEADRVIFVTNRTGYSDIYVDDLDSGGLKGGARLLLRGERTAELESLHFLQSGIDVSDANVLVFSSKSGANDVLNFFDIEESKIVDTFSHLDIVSISSPQWSTDGSTVAFSGTDWRGYQDLYLLRASDMALTRLTDDFYADRHPTFSQDGRYLAFSSDRGAFGQEGYFNLFVYDLQNGTIDPLTEGRFNDISPDWSFEYPNRLVFSSDRDGSYNLWMLDGVNVILSESSESDQAAHTISDMQNDRLAASSRIRQLTRFTTGAFDPHWSGENDKDLLFTAFENFRFQIHLLEDVSGRMSGVTPNRSRVSRKDESWKRLPMTGHSEKRGVPYQKKYSFDIAQTAIAYDPIFGFLGGAQVTMSDLLGNDYYHFLLFNTAETTSDFMKRFNIAVTRVDLSRRINLGYGLFHFASDYFSYSDGFFFERRYGGQFALSYPFSVFKRMEVTSSAWKSRRHYYGKKEPFQAFLVSNSLSYVFDNSVWGPVGPVDGTSYRFTLGQSIDFSRSSIYYSGFLGDYRKYFRTSLQTLYALRIMVWLNRGHDLFRFLLGGSWGLRGYERTEVAGQNFVLVNNEFRFPFAQQLLLRFSSVDIGISPIRGAAFFDVGNAWNRKFNGLLGSVGVGLRGNLFGIVVLRLDIGKTTDFHSLSQGLFTQFFFGWNY